MNKSEFKELSYTINNDEDADYVINTLKNQLQFYKDKNSQFDSTLSKLKLTPDSLNFTSRETLDKFTTLQNASGVNKFDLVDVQMSYLEYASAKCNYDNKTNILKRHLEDIQQFTADVIKETEFIEKEMERANNRLESINAISENELQKLRIYIKSYEEKFLQYINKYPWLNEPEYNLLSIQEEIKKVYRLQDEVKDLRKEVECYCGLKPEIFSAKNQLIKIKTEYENISKLVANKE